MNIAAWNTHRAAVIIKLMNIFGPIRIKDSTVLGYNYIWSQYDTRTTIIQFLACHRLYLQFPIFTYDIKCPHVFVNSRFKDEIKQFFHVEFNSDINFIVVNVIIPVSS